MILILAGLVALCGAPASAANFNAFGPKQYVRGEGDPVTVTDTFTVLNPSTTYTLRIVNGSLTDSEVEHVSTSIITLNGVQIVNANELNQNTTVLEKTVTVQASNTLTVLLRGRPNGEITLTIRGVDDDLPTITAAVAPSPNAAGWNNSNVTVTFTCDDATSGVASCPEPVTVATEVAGQVVSGTVTDNAGNTANASVTINLDKTAPLITAAIAPSPNAAGWNKNDVTVTFTCSDALSGVASCSPPATITTETAGQVVTGTVVDLAGNTAGVSVTIKLDKTAPTITAAALPVPNAAGWNNSNVTVTFTCSDSLSGMATCPSPITVSAEGAAQVISGTAIDVAGNTATASVTVSLDKTAPTITAAANPAPNAAGWNKADVTVSFTCSDALSGIDQCPQPVLVTTETSASGQTVTGSVTDRAGNTASASLTVKLDKTAPTLSITSPANGTTVSNPPLTITGTATDALSGLATVTCNATTATLSPPSGFTCNLTLVNGLNAIAVQAVDVAGNIASTALNVTLSSGPVISSFNPASAPFGTLITVNGSNFTTAGATPQVTLAKQGGGTIVAPLASATATTITFVVPAGAATGPITITLQTNNGSSATPLTITPSTDFSLSAAPGAVNLFQGRTVALTVTASSTNFPHLAALTLSGLPSGITFTFNPQQITAGATSILTLTAPGGQALGTSNLTITATASVDGFTVVHSAAASVTVVGPTTSFIGRVVSTDALETSIAGVLVKFLGKDDTGATTGCTGQSSTDAAGNFAITGLAANCTSRQLIRFDGTTATAPPGAYGGVDLIFTLFSGAVTASPVLVHLPRIDNAEVFNITQNSGSDQTFTSTTVPGVKFTVYAGSVLTRSDGSQPNPYPMTLVKIPLDRLPDAKPPVPSMSMSFLVSFGPVGTAASKQVAVTYPNYALSPPGTQMALMTLDPTKGMMVPYGTGTVTADVGQIEPDLDSANPGQRFGIRNFDWHGPMPPPAPISPCPECERAAQAGDPVDLMSGLQVVRGTDIGFGGLRGGVSIQRTYRNLSSAPGPFGLGTGHNYSYRLASNTPNTDAAIPLVMPDGNRFRFVRQLDGTLINTDIPQMRGAVITTFADGSADLRFKDGLVFHFVSGGYLVSITDPNGNAVTITRQAGVPDKILSVTDPVGRSLTFLYDGQNRITSVTDPLTRSVTYTYNGGGRLATVTNPMNGVMSYGYDGNGLLTTITNERNIVVAQNVYDPAGTGKVISQTRPDGGVISFANNPVNPTVLGVTGPPVTGSAWIGGGPAASPNLKSVVTDPKGNKTTYRFDSNGFPVQVTDALGQTRTFEREAGSNLLKAMRGNGECATCGDSAAGDISHTYDSKGNVLTVTDALGTTTLTYEPVFSRLTSIQDSLGNTASFTYDAKGNMTSRTDASGNRTQYVYNSFGLLTEVIDPLDHHTTFTYDDKGNLIWTTDALGNIMSITYDAVSRPVAVKDPLGRRSTTEYDGLDRVTQQTDPKGQVVMFEYDAASNLTKLTDPRGKQTAFTYDNMNRLSTRTDPKLKTDTRTYDLNGNLLTFTDRRAQTATFGYDALDRLTTETYNDSAVTRSYDANGRPVRVVDSMSGSFTFSYGTVGLLRSTVNPVGAVTYGRDGLGRVASRQVVGQPAQTHTYDPAGNPSTAATTGASVSWTYDALNRVAAIPGSNGITTSYAYDPVSRLKSITHGSLGTDTFEYDAAGQRVKRTTPFAQALTTPASASTVDDANRLLTRDAATYTHDDNGNRLTDGANTYTWDSRNRLQSIITPSGTFTFTYDSAGNLIQQTSPGGSQQFVLDDLTNVAYANGVSYLTARSIDTHLAAVTGGVPTFALNDAINSTVFTTDSSGTVLSRFYYEPYGQTTVSGASYPFQFTGRGPITGNVYHYRARFYDAGAGRFLSEDPVGLEGDNNSYRYARGLPNVLRDPFGLDVEIYERPVNFSWIPDIVAKYFLPYHQWVKTDTLEAGLGNRPGVIPGQGNADSPGRATTMTVDHPGESRTRNARRLPLPFPVDEGCVNDLIRPGRPMGTFMSPFAQVNNCQAFVRNVLESCRKKRPRRIVVTPCISHACRQRVLEVF